MSADDQLRKVLKEYGEDFNDKGTVWRVQGTAVISHKALERIAAKAGIKYASPTIIRAERDEAVLLVSGTLGDRMEWSIGEALVNVNYRVSGKQAGYVWAMAEKRAKDRVILKLVSLHGLAYSEEEADEFKDRPASQRQSDCHLSENMHQDDGPSWDEVAQQFIAECEQKIANSKDPMALKTWWASSERKTRCAEYQLNEAELQGLKDKMIARGIALSERIAA